LLITIAAKDDKLKFVATDSYRLAEKVVKIEKASEEEMSFIVPARTMSELAKILGRSQDKEVKINVTKNQVLFKVDGIELISRLVEGSIRIMKRLFRLNKRLKWRFL
jgi:DNA polymerase-3 subunit beta